MSQIREYTAADLAAVKRLHKGGFEFPDLTHPLVLVKKVLVDDADKVRMAAFGRLHINAMLFVDGRYKTPDERLAAIEELQKDMIAQAATFGLDIATTQAEGRFAERLRDMGWTRGFGEMFFRSIE